MYLNVNAYFPYNEIEQSIKFPLLYNFIPFLRFIVISSSSFYPLLPLLVISRYISIYIYIYVLIFAPFFTRINDSITKFRLAEFAARRSRNTRKINASSEKREWTELKEILVVLKRESVERSLLLFNFNYYSANRISIIFSYIYIYYCK